tara:strand:- start:5961 stop:6266 length:306 start_codon:yes stop_codon:yes gene_type:complete
MNDPNESLVKNILSRDTSQPTAPRSEWQSIESKINSSSIFFNLRNFAFAASILLVVVAYRQVSDRPAFSEDEKVDIYSYVLEDTYFDNGEEVTNWASVDSL